MAPHKTHAISVIWLLQVKDSRFKDMTCLETSDIEQTRGFNLSLYYSKLMSLFCIDQISMKWTTMKDSGKFWGNNYNWWLKKKTYKNMYRYQYSLKLLVYSKDLCRLRNTILNSLYKYIFLLNKHILPLVMPIPNIQMRKWYMITFNKYWTVFLLLSRHWVWPKIKNWEILRVNFWSLAISSYGPVIFRSTR